MVCNYFAKQTALKYTQDMDSVANDYSFAADQMEHMRMTYYNFGERIDDLENEVRVLTRQSDQNNKDLGVICKQLKKMKVKK